MNRLTLLLGFILTMLLVAACGTTSTPGPLAPEPTQVASQTPQPTDPSDVNLQTQLDQNRQRWDSESRGSYRMEFQWHCFWHPTYTSPVVILVEPGDVLGSVVYSDDGLPVDQTAFGGFRSVDGLFELIQDAIDREPFRMSVQYHPDMGYQILVEIDFV